MIRVRQIKIEALSSNLDLIKEKTAKKLGVLVSDFESFSIYKESLDARKKSFIFYVYEVEVSLKEEKKIVSKLKDKDVLLVEDRKYLFPSAGNQILTSRPVVVGSGPAGLFCAYFLAKYGYQPIVVERGEPVEDRIKTVQKFWETGILNTESNVQFGEGGAGTFSDGKLNTMVHDESFRNQEVLKLFVECGAPDEILYSYKPHIGTDILMNVVKNMREKIISFGGEFLYRSCFTDFEVENNLLQRIQVGNQTLECNCLVLAIGHSSRDTFYKLYEKKLFMEAKPFAVGLRVEHPQDLINENQFGSKYKDLLGSASYKLTYKATNGRGVYSFCMCPGGYVVNASSEENLLAVNGMSYHGRDSKNANSAIIVTVFPKDFGSNPLDGISFQRELEKKAYKLGSGKIPIQLLKDYQSNQVSTGFGFVEPVIKGSYQFADLNLLFSKEINESLKEAFESFGNRILNFNHPDTLLAGVESRTSSPVKILRNEEFEANIKGIYPCGEGAGWAGGITSAAMDGIKVAEAIRKKYQPFDKNR